MEDEIRRENYETGILYATSRRKHGLRGAAMRGWRRLPRLFGPLALCFALNATALAADTEPGSAERGAELWAKCKACHTIEPGGRHTVGPNLHGIMGRKAAALSDYRYSPALQKSGLVWDDATLDRYLAATQDVVPGGKMYGGLAIEQDRLDLLAWLRTKM